MDHGIQTEVPIEAPLVQEESSWEVESENSEFFSESDEGSDEESGDEVLRPRSRKVTAISQLGIGNGSGL